MKLKQVVNISSGHPFRGKIYETANASVCVIQMKDVSVDEGINWNTCIKAELTGSRKAEWLKSGDILFVARGNHNYAVLVDKIPYQIRAVASPHFYVLSCTSEKILPNFLAWFLNQDSCQRYYQRKAEGTVTKSIRRSLLELTPIAVPVINKQNSIIKLAEVLKQKQQILKQLNSNAQIFMNSIANDLLNDLN